MKKAYLLFLAAMLSTATFADNKQTVKIDGQVIDKTVTEITFDGDNVVLQYSDNTSDQADMSLVTLSFTYQTTGISQIEDIKKLYGEYLVKVQMFVFMDKIEIIPQELLEAGLSADEINSL